MMRNKIIKAKHKFGANVIYRKTELENGVRLVTEQVPGYESFALGYCINIGSADDKKNYEGLAHFMEHISFRRTKNYTGKRLVNEFESIGAYVNAFTTKEQTCFYVRALNKHLPKCIKLLSEIVANPVMLEREIQKEKDIILEEIISYEDDPEELIFDLGEEMLFHGSGYSHPIAGRAESVKRINSAVLEEHHKNYYSSQNIVVSYSGSVSHLDVAHLVGRAYLPHSKNTRANINNDFIQFPKPRKLVLEKQFQQSHQLFMIPTDGMHSNNRYIWGIINNILGEGLSSRLNQTLREKHAYVYSVYSTLSLMKNAGIMSIYAACDKTKMNRIEELILTEIDKIHKNSFTEKEIRSAKQQLISNTIMALEGVSEKMQSLARSECACCEYESLEDTINMIQEITKDQIFEIIKKNLTPSNWSEVQLVNI